MFYGLSKFFKNILPKRLFYRALLIVAVPILVLQLVITIVFFDSLWIKTNKGMTRALINEISTFIEVYDNEKIKKEELTNLFSIFLDLNIEFKENEIFKYEYNERWFSPIDRTLRRELKSNFNFGEYWFDTTSYNDLIHINIKHNDGYFEFFISPTNALVIPLFVLIQRLSKKTIEIVICKISIGIATINKAL
jgi:two-component system osmolarity sensor histidine kinase EnvZ